MPVKPSQFALQVVLFIFIYLFIHLLPSGGCAAKLIGRDHGMEAYLEQIFDAQA